jgi:hypothetical protein
MKRFVGLKLKHYRMVDNMLAEGDVIEIKSEHKVYAMVPQHFIYSNKKGCFDLACSVVIVGNFDYLAGTYIVIKTNMEGGSTGRDSYPDGHRVYCVKADDKDRKIDFYQSGFFSAMITEIEPIGKAELKWVIAEDKTKTL